MQTPKGPLPQPYRGSEIGSFAHATVTRRFPKIIAETIQDNDFPPRVIQRLEQLTDEIHSGYLRLLEDPAAPDIEDWQAYITPYRGSDWLQVPWFIVEMYFYRRILEAIGYYQNGSLKGFDPFLKQKQHALESASASIRFLADLLEESLASQEKDERYQSEILHHILRLNVWSNQADLSMWSSNDVRPDHQSSKEQQSHLLVDQAELVCEYLKTHRGGIQRVDIILDNYGPELVHDLGLADYLLGSKMVSHIRVHAKPCPHYVSDAMIKDIYTTINYLMESDYSSVQGLARRIKGHLDLGSLELTEDYFWTSPLYFWDMPARIYRELDESDLVISKGDANYRRLAGDLDWLPTTPFADVVRYIPSPLLALRVHKAELALGLRPEQVRELDAQDPNWKVNGNWAVIQFYHP